MVDLFFFALTLAAALGSGLMAGVFFAFSTFVMRALARRPSGEAIAAMQSINVTVLNPWFLGLFLGTAAAATFAIIVAIMRWNKPGVVFLFAGSVLYLVGTFVVTIMFNVPLKNSLATVAPGDLDGPQQWGTYLRRWTAWNHVRTTAALAAAGSFTIALRSAAVGELGR